MQRIEQKYDIHAFDTIDVIGPSPHGNLFVRLNGRKYQSGTIYYNGRLQKLTVRLGGKYYWVDARAEYEEDAENMLFRVTYPELGLITDILSAVHFISEGDAKRLGLLEIAEKKRKLREEYESKRRSLQTAIQEKRNTTYTAALERFGATGLLLIDEIIGSKNAQELGDKLRSRKIRTPFQRRLRERAYEVFCAQVLSCASLMKFDPNVWETNFQQALLDYPRREPRFRAYSFMLRIFGNGRKFNNYAELEEYFQRNQCR